MAIISSILTLKLTASTSFVTRKESGVLSEQFAHDEPKAGGAAGAEPKRRVLYYVSVFSHLSSSLFHIAPMFERHMASPCGGSGL